MILSVFHVVAAPLRCVLPELELEHPVGGPVRFLTMRYAVKKGGSLNASPG
jgi:hypothetical protein